MFYRFLKSFSPEALLFLVYLAGYMFLPSGYFLMFFVFIALVILFINKSLLSTVWILAFYSLLLQNTLPFDFGNINFLPNLKFDSYWFFYDPLIVIMVYMVLSRYRKIRNGPAGSGETSDLALLVFLAVASFVSLRAGSQQSYAALILLLKFSAVYFLSKLILSDKSILIKTLEIIYFYVLASSVLIIAQYLIGGPLGFDFEDSFLPFGKYAEANLFRPGGFSSDPNISATFSAVILPFSIYKLNKFKALPQPVLLGSLGIIFLGLIFTASRAAWIAGILTAVLSVKYILNNRGKIYSKDKFRFKFVTALVILLSGPFIISRLVSFSQAFRTEGSAFFRFHQLKLGYLILKDNPFGVGLGQFREVSSGYLPQIGSGVPADIAHNMLVDVLTATGIPGFIIFSIFLFLLYKKLYGVLISKPDDLTKAVIFSFAGMSMLMLAYPWFLHPRIGWLFWMLAGIEINYEKNIK